MSKIDGTDPSQLSSAAELFTAQFSEDSFIAVPLNSEQLLSAIEYMQDSLLQMPPNSSEFLGLRKTVRTMLGTYEDALGALQQREAAKSAGQDVEALSVDPTASEDSDSEEYEKEYEAVADALLVEA